MKPTKLLLTLVAAIAFSAPSFAGPTDGWRPIDPDTNPTYRASAQQNTHPAVVQINNGGTKGSGTLIYQDSREGVILTCAHLFVGRIGGTGVEVTFPNGKVYIARLIAWDEHPDLAALTIARPDVEPMPVATDPPRKGELLHSAGYGGGRGYRVSTGAMLSDTAPETGRGWFSKAGNSRGGDSGGPIFNQQNELVGVLHHTDHNSTLGTSNGRICEFVKVGRYLFPWNAQVEIEKIKSQAPIPLPGPSPLPVLPATPDPQTQARLSVLENDVLGLKSFDANLTTKIAELQKVADKAEELGLLAGEGLSSAADAVALLQGEVQGAVTGAVEAAEEVSRLGSLFGKLDSVTEKIPVVGWTAGKIAALVGIPTTGVVGLLFGLGFLMLRRDIRQFRETGGTDPLAGRRLADLTPWTIDDRIMDIVERRLGRGVEEAEPAPAPRKRK